MTSHSFVMKSRFYNTFAFHQEFWTFFLLKLQPLYIVLLSTACVLNEAFHRVCVCVHQTSPRVKAVCVPDVPPCVFFFFNLSNLCVLVPAALVLLALSFIVCRWDDILSLSGQKCAASGMVSLFEIAVFAKWKWVSQSHHARTFTWGCKKKRLCAPSQTVLGAN